MQNAESASARSAAPKTSNNNARRPARKRRSFTLTRMAETSHYFDWAASAPPDEDILRSALSVSVNCFGNPSSLHGAGSAARAALENARARCARALGVSPQTLYFTSGGTESNHIPLVSLLHKAARGTILISGIEHPSVREQAYALQKCGWRVQRVMPEADGIVAPEAVAAKLTEDTHLVCVMAVNNETGAIQPLQRIAETLALRSHGKRRPRLHADCVQAAGKIPLNLQGIDSASFSAHKICGPRGTGLLYLAQKQEPFLRGGGQEDGIRSGTENLSGAEAVSLCMERYCITARNVTARQRHDEQKIMCHAFIQSLLSTGRCTLIPSSRARLDAHAMAELYSPWIVQAAFKGIPGQVMVRALDDKGFAISTGSACSARKAGRPVLEAMNIAEDLSETAVRFSFGPHTTSSSMQELAHAVREVCSTFS